VEHCGIDLHGKSSEVAVVDEAGEVVETARIPTTEAGLSPWFRGWVPMRICLEAGGMSAWAERILVGLGHEVVVCNPARVRLIAESTLKNDTGDAETLAGLVRMDMRLRRPTQHRGETTQRLRACCGCGASWRRGSQEADEPIALGEGRPRLDALGASTLPRRARWGVEEYLTRACKVHGLELRGLSGRRKDETTARLRELLTLIGVEVYGLRVKDLAERMRMNPGSASRVLARAAKREREDVSFHKQRLHLEGRLAKLDATGTRSRR
jgi:hypothetical protein